MQGRPEDIPYYYPEKERVSPRLFQCSEASGLFTVDEVWPFEQEDLSSDDAFILDGITRTYVWGGRISTQRERKMTMLTCIAYASEAGDENPIYIKEGEEPMEFVAHFHGWQWTPKRRMASQAFAKPRDCYRPDAHKLELVKDIINEYDREYTYEELSNKKFQIAAGLDLTRLESYLSDEEFQRVFKVPRAEFNGFSEWKKEQMRKDVNLF